MNGDQYLIVDLNEGAVHSTNNQDDVDDYKASEDHIVIDKYTSTRYDPSKDTWVSILLL